MQAFIVSLKHFANNFNILTLFSQKKFNFKSLQTKKDIARLTLGLLFIGASSLHFINDAELQIIPTFLPWRRAALYITGICEFIGGIGLLIPRFQRLAAWGLVALLVAIFPANIYHAVKNIQLGGVLNSRVYHWIRLPFQAVFIWWALWSTSHTHLPSLNAKQ